jgi:hypothetical protein
MNRYRSLGHLDIAHWTQEHRDITDLRDGQVS